MKLILYCEFFERATLVFAQRRLQNGQQAFDPITTVTTVEIKQTPQHIIRRIAFQINQHEKQLQAYACLGFFPAAFLRSQPRLLLSASRAFSYAL